MFRPKSRTNTSTSIGINITAACMSVIELIVFKNLFIIEEMNRVYMGTIKTNVICIIIIILLSSERTLILIHKFLTMTVKKDCYSHCQKKREK